MANILYVDATRPDDSGNGLTQGAAKKTPRAAQNIAAAGDTILIKTGYYYAPVDGVHMFFSAVSNVTIGTYGTLSDKPILDALTYQNPSVGGWTYINSGVWKKTFGAFYIRRLWVGCRNNGILVADRYIGTAKRRAYGVGLAEVSGSPASANPSEATIIANLNSSKIWFGGGLATSYALYVYTGTSLQDPPTFYDGLAFIQSEGAGVGKVGSVAGIHVQNQTGIICRDIHFRGNGGTGIRLQAQNSDTRDVADCLFEDCIVTAPYQGAFVSRIAGEATPTRRCTKTTVRGVYFDYMSSADETESDQSYSNLSGVSDGFSISDGSVAISVEGCTSIDSLHQGIVAGSTAMRTTPPSGCRMINNTVRFSSWSVYARGLSNYDGDTYFNGNLIDGQNTRSQIAGSGKVIGNVWKNLGNSIRKPDVAEWIACESYIIDLFTGSIGNERYMKVQPVAVVIAHNTVYSPIDPAISFNFFTSSLDGGGNTFPAGAINILNNIIDSPASTWVRTYEDSGKVIGQQNFANNCVFNSATGDNKVAWRGSNYTLNAAPGFTTNIETDPLLGSDMRPKAGSPCIATGLHLGYFRGYDSKHFQVPPSIGAHEYVRPRNSRT